MTRENTTPRSISRAILKSLGITAIDFAEPDQRFKRAVRLSNAGLIAKISGLTIHEVRLFFRDKFALSQVKIDKIQEVVDRYGLHFGALSYSRHTQHFYAYGVAGNPSEEDRVNLHRWCTWPLMEPTLHKDMQECIIGYKLDEWLIFNCEPKSYQHYMQNMCFINCGEQDLYKSVNSDNAELSVILGLKLLKHKHRFQVKVLDYE